jgi:acetyl esterase/lipase
MVTAFLLWAMLPKVEPDVVFTKVGDTELKMDLYYPSESAPKTNAAVVVIHGGAWISGDRKQMAPLAQHFASKGLFAASVQYRLAPKHKWPAMLDDVQSAVRYLRANAAKYGFDPNRIGAAGASAGGHLSLFLGARDTRDAAGFLPEHSSRVTAVFDIFGPTDMTRDFPASTDMLYQMVLGKPRQEAEQEIRNASPLLFIDKNSAPVFIFQGLADPLVNPNQSRYLEAKYKEVGVPVQAVYVEGVGHELPVDKNPKVKQAVEQGTDWLIKHLTD